jgi:hypothetical protein
MTRQPTQRAGPERIDRPGSQIGNDDAARLRDSADGLTGLAAIGAHLPFIAVDVALRIHTVAIGEKT